MKSNDEVTKADIGYSTDELTHQSVRFLKCPSVISAKFSSPKNDNLAPFRAILTATYHYSPAENNLHAHLEIQLNKFDRDTGQPGADSILAPMQGGIKC